MKVDIYKIRKTTDPAERRYLLIPSGADLTTLPQELRTDMGELEYERTIDILPGEKRIALEADEAIKNITSMGYHIQGTQIQSKIAVGLSQKCHILRPANKKIQRTAGDALFFLLLAP